MSAIFFDTDCELWYTQADELGVNVIEMPYTIDDEEYFYDLGRHTDFKQFYDKMRAGSMPITSALNPQQYTEIFEPFFQKGEEIFYISFSHKLSGTFNHLETALKDLNTRYPGVRFVRYDTLNISFGGGYMVWLAVKYIQAGHTIDETIAYLDQIAGHINLQFVVDDLNHLHRGGRLSKASAVVGSLLGIKPILHVTDEGTLEVKDKIKGTKKAINYLVDDMKAHMQDATMPIVVLDADSPETGNALENKVREAYPDATIWHYTVGPVIGTHCGPGTLALLYYGESR